MLSTDGLTVLQTEVEEEVGSLGVFLTAGVHAIGAVVVLELIGDGTCDAAVKVIDIEAE